MVEPWGLLATRQQIERCLVRFARRADSSAQTFVGNINVDLRDDTAWSETYFFDVTNAGEGRCEAPCVTVEGGRWVDRLEIGPGGWGVADHEAIIEWHITLPSQTGLLDSPSDQLIAVEDQPSMTIAIDRESVREVVARTLLEQDTTVESVEGSDHADPFLPLRHSHHDYVFSQLVDLDGDVACSDAYYLSVESNDKLIEGELPAELVLRGGRRIERLERTETGWRVTEQSRRRTWEAVGDASRLALFLTPEKTIQPKRAVPATLSATPTLSDAVDQMAIRDCLMLWARGVDRLDEQAIRQACSESATFNGQALPEFIEYCFAQREKRTATLHYLAQSVIDLDGDRAVAETAYFALIGVKQGEDPGFMPSVTGGAPVDEITLQGGPYVFHLARAVDGWKLVARNSLRSWHVVADASEMDEWPESLAVRGRRDRDDLSYRRATPEVGEGIQ